MGNNIDISTQMNDILQLYSDDVLEEVKDICKEEAKNLVDTLKDTSPKESGKYAKGWAVKEQRNNDFSAAYTIYNKTEYQKTHLLEFGHLNRDGSRTKAIPHIKPAEENAVATVTERIEKAVSGK